VAHTVEVITHSETLVPHSDVTTPCTDQAHVDVKLACAILKVYIVHKKYSVTMATEAEVQVAHTNPSTQVIRMVTFRGSDANMDVLHMFASNHIFTHITDL
jgi:hypothetical protein